MRVNLMQYGLIADNRLMLDLLLNDGQDTILKEIMQKIKEKYESVHGELHSNPIKADDQICQIKIRNLDQLKVLDLNGSEVELEMEGEHFAIIEFRLAEIYLSKIRNTSAMVLPCKSIKYC